MKYDAPWWLPGGNLQTIWPALYARRSVDTRPRYRRERWDTPDGDFLDLDWLEDEAPTPDASCTAGLRNVRAGSCTVEQADAGPTRRTCRGIALRPGAPERAGLAWGGPALRPLLGPRTLLVLFHGLEGSSRSHYAQAFADFARERGLAYVVPHFRGCGGELNQGPRAYHSGDHEEIAWILARLRVLHRGPLIAAGISLGGNALMRWAGEVGSEAGQLADAVAAVCSPVDLAAGSLAIGRGFNRRVYTTMFLRSMKPKALAKWVQHPGLFDRARLMAARDLYQFDDIFTAPLHGFRNADDYYTRASAKPHLHRIRIPALLLNALNDPFVPAASLPAPSDVGAWVTLWQPREGGHVGFPGGSLPGHVRTMPDEVGGWLLSKVA